MSYCSRRWWNFYCVVSELVNVVSIVIAVNEGNLVSIVDVLNAVSVNDVAN